MLGTGHNLIPSPNASPSLLPTRAAITLLEILVSLFVVSLLAALALPTLRATTLAASNAANLTNLRHTAIDFLEYAHDNNTSLPNVGLPPNPHVHDDWFYRAPGELTLDAQADLYWSQAFCWPRLMTRWKGRFEEHWHAVVGPDVSMLSAEQPSQVLMRTLTEWAFTHFRYSPSLFTAPTMWTYPGRTYASNTEMLAEYEIVPLARVAFPSSKAMLVDLHRYDRALRAGPVSYAFIDGSARVRDAREGQPAAGWPRGHEPERRGFRGLATIDGYLGSDF